MGRISENDIVGLIQDALQPSGKRITIDSTTKDVEEWDSLGHLGVLAALDTFFDGKVGDIKEIGTADSVRKILQILREHSLI